MGYTLAVLHCPLTVDYRAYCVGRVSQTFFVCWWMGICGGIGTYVHYLVVQVDVLVRECVLEWSI